ncbi:hypothetical protein B0H10DRAFT_1947770 [Mycena sp. CBHHK59/15]|nr:hypothetical protein B0H10DRAFT_1947770 [Mycena sp. CBHHK59/15]
MSRSARNPGNGCRRLSVPPIFTVRQRPALLSIAGPSKSAARLAVKAPVFETATTILAIVKEVGEMLRGVPYVKAISGVILQIIKIKEELTDNKWRCQELIDKVVRRSETIFSGLKKIAQSPGRDGLKDLEHDLVAYTMFVSSRSSFSPLTKSIRLLNDVYAALMQCTSRKISDRVDRWLNRGQLLDDMLKLERLLDDFRVNFSDNRLVQIEIHMNTLLRRGPSNGDREKAAIIATLMGSSPARVAILGAGGIGKTTLAMSVLYDPQVVGRYESRYFVACDGVTSAELLLTELANVLRLPRDQLDENMHDLVLASFRRDKVVICFDNLETAWDNPDGRRAVEELLMEFTDIPNLAVLVTMRGTQRPAPSAGWSMPFLPPLHSLHFADAADVFLQISGKMDEFAEQMIKEVDCIPLAVTLLGHLAQEENETTVSLAKRWVKERTALIENGGEDRLSKLDTSIQCSISSPRMLADSSATDILALLSILPDGFPNREGMLDRLQTYLPQGIHLQKAISTLRRVALVHGETLWNTPRLRLLSPVRHFSKANLHIPPEFRTALVDMYIQMLEDGRDYSDPSTHTFLPPEFLNIRSVFAEAYENGDRREALVKASITYTEWLVYMGSGSAEIIHLAIQSTPDSDELLASCFYWLGKLCMRRNDVQEAHRAFSRAIELHIQAQDISGEAYDLYELGSLYIWWGKLEEAEGYFNRALELHRQRRDVLGEAYDLLDLGKLLMRRGQLEDAEESTSCALELLREAQNVVGQAHAMRRLGGVYIRQDRLDEAEQSFYEAVKLHRQTKSVLGEAHDMRRLGGLYMWRHQLEEAEISFTKAAELHKKSHDILGEANDMLNMGELHMERGQLFEAESFFNHALRLHRQTQNVLGEANDMQNLGELYIRRNRLAEAELCLTKAVKLHRQSQDVMGEAKDMQKIGELYVSTGELDEAEKALSSAVELHRQARSLPGEAYGLQSLAKLYTQRGKACAATRSLTQANELKARLSSVGSMPSERDIGLNLIDLTLRCRLQGSGYSTPAFDHLHLLDYSSSVRHEVLGSENARKLTIREGNTQSGSIGPDAVKTTLYILKEALSLLSYLVSSFMRSSLGESGARGDQYRCRGNQLVTEVGMNLSTAAGRKY